MNKEITALRDDLHALTARIASLETAGVSARPRKNAEELYHQQIHDNLTRERATYNSPFAIAFATMVMQSADRGDMGTAVSVTTLSEEKNLPTDSALDARIQKFARLIADPLIPRVFRELLRPRFHNKPRQATAAELATALQTTPEHIEIILRPLVEDQTLQRGLSAANVAFYEWDGNTARVMCLLLQD